MGATTKCHARGISFLFCRLPVTPCSHTRPRPLFCAASDEKQGGGLGTSDKKLGGAWEQGLQKFQSLYCTLAQPLFQGSICYMQYNSVWLDSIASFHYGNWRALHYLACLRHARFGKFMCIYSTMMCVKQHHFKILRVSSLIVTWISVIQ